MKYIIQFAIRLIVISRSPSIAFPRLCISFSFLREIEALYHDLVDREDTVKSRLIQPRHRVQESR